MATQTEIDKAKQKLKDKWDDEGDCSSCGWHASLYEHHVDDYDIEEALDTNNGWLELGCVSKDDEDSGLHRTIKIFVGENGNR